ncbi:XRE family transcriptional regulator [uncultured Oscillibacter sp.]|uniref:XRE family transcriptional regulator n=1 Tax=uncultured Oscillibacter sp. TaxID=876091 RepID=UPI00262EAC81|nr:XRE family transcriptional regulator [uncultured Oscillibacter sp.]
MNISKLRGKIVESGYTQEKLAAEISMNKSTFSRKMKSNALEFFVGEMHRIVAALNLSAEDAVDIFLT